MRVRFVLSPERDRELVALRLCSFLDFNSLAKSAVLAYVRGSAYEIEIPVTNKFIERPMRCSFTLDNEADADVVKFIKSLKCSRSYALKNIIMMSVRGRPQATYQNEALNSLLLEMAVSGTGEETALNIEEEIDEASYWKSVADSIGNF